MTNNKTRTRPTKASVKSFISSVTNETRRKDAKAPLKLADVDTAVLQDILRKGVEAAKRRWPVTAS